MENLIRSIIELDKQKRLELENLQKEKGKIGAFVREKSVEIEKKYKDEVEVIYTEKKAEYERVISEAESQAKLKYEMALKEIEMVFEKHHQEWADDLFNYCVNNFVKDEAQ